MLMRIRRLSSSTSLPSLNNTPLKYRPTSSRCRHNRRKHLGLLLVAIFSFILLINSGPQQVARVAVRVVRAASSADRRIYHLAKAAVNDWHSSNHPSRPLPHLFQHDYENVQLLVEKALIPPVFVSRLGITGRRKLLRRLTADTAGILTYEHIPKIIIADLQNGLGNRLRVLASAMEFAFYTRRVLVVLWASDRHLNASMHHLFDQSVIDNFLLIENPISWPIDPNNISDDISQQERSYMPKIHPGHPSRFSVRYFNFMAKDLKNDLTSHLQNDVVTKVTSNDREIKFVLGRHIYIKTAYVLDSQWNSNKLINAFMQALTPAPVVQDLVRHVEDSCGGSTEVRRMIGVHIRSRTLENDNKWIDSECEYTAEGAARTDNWRKKSAPHHFITEMRRTKQRWTTIIASSYALQAAKPWSALTAIEMANSDNDLSHVTSVDVSIPPRFYVSADSLETIQLLYKTFDPHEVVSLPRRCDDRSSECMQYAFADLILLSRTGAMLGSGWSSFTEAASRLRVRPPGVDPSRTDGYTLRLSGIDFGIPDKWENMKEVIQQSLPWTEAYKAKKKETIISEAEMNRRCQRKRARRHSNKNNSVDVG